MTEENIRRFIEEDKAFDKFWTVEEDDGYTYMTLDVIGAYNYLKSRFPEAESLESILKSYAL